ncbi:MAG: homocysteine S-methyltransferase family protein [Coriobacteriales bacterium]|jgi:5-methyltetrahydrofolate--homocysteine methyltransferase|nr:homocysteine S-methyltransferase family protein [Coriobacteriales bacterium]
MFDIRSFVRENVLLLDGAMGTMLQRRGLEPGELPELLNLSAPDDITAIHAAYLKAGANVITTNTFQANEYKLGSQALVNEVVAAAVGCARAAGARHVALDVGPLGQLLAPMGSLSFERAYAAFQVQMQAGERAGADLIIIETIADPYEAKAAILAARETTQLPIICTLTFDANGRTFVGCDARTAVLSLQELGLAAFGANCSLGPSALRPIIKVMLEYCQLPVVLQANAGMPVIREGQTVYATGPEQYAREVLELVDQGVGIVGGCCGTTPAYIQLICEGLAGIKPRPPRPLRVCAASSGSKSVIFDEGIVAIGERLNPTGKKRMQQALREGTLSYLLDEALRQQEANAQILDVNVGIPEIDESVVLPTAIRELQAVVTTPLEIDSADPAAIEAAARIYNGKPLINSVNGKQEVMDAIFPIVRRYGAAVIGLTLDENGIPSSAEGRLAIAQRILETAKEYGIARENLLIDCLVLTASAQQEQVRETLKAVALVKDQLGLKTVLGISNVSYGLPEREVINATFLAACLGAGLDAAILNPLSWRYQDVLAVFRLLNSEDKGARLFLQRQARAGSVAQAATSVALVASTASIATTALTDATVPTGTNMAPIATTALTDATLFAHPSVEPIKQAGEIASHHEAETASEQSLSLAIERGQRELAAQLTENLLKDSEPLQIINRAFIPALNRVGERYESGEIFLPQLLQAAQSAQSGFAVLSQASACSDGVLQAKGTILLATVEGDIHDIGKNIVKMLLENYGYKVIDLGKDVPAARIVEAVRKDGIRLVGLSALMTTTVRSMQATITAVREAHLDCAFFVGGAVLNEDYAQMVGADFYARDAMEGVLIANRFFAQNKDEGLEPC